MLQTNTNIENMQQLIKNEAGILVSPDFLIKSKDNLQKAGEVAIDNYRKKRNEAINAPIPDIEVPFSYVLTKAVPPKMVNALKSLGLHQEKLDVDERFLEQMKYMNENVSDEQEIVCVGDLVNEIFKVGKIVKINYARYRTIRDNNDGVIQTTYDIPTYIINDHKYIMIDQRDILWTMKENNQQEEEDEVI